MTEPRPSRPDRRALLAALAPLALAMARPSPLRARGARLDEAALAPVIKRAAGLSQLHCLALAHRGETVFARAFRGPAPDRPANVKSVSKTLIAALTGAALARGEIASSEQSLADLAPGLIPKGADPRLGRIRVADLLTMRAGLEPTSGPRYGAWVNSADWVRFALTRPFVAEPGARMQYSTGAYHVLGALLAEVSGISLLEQARRRLGAPLGVEIPPWTRDPQGRYMGGNNMALSPLAMLRFGELYRRDGEWEGAQLLPRGWVEASWTPRARSPWSGDEYGYGWFLTEAGGGLLGGGHRVAYARGYGGQAIYVVPSLELSVAITSDPNRPARGGGHFGDLNALLADRIIPAAEALA